MSRTFNGSTDFLRVFPASQLVSAIPFSVSAMFKPRIALPLTDQMIWQQGNSPGSFRWRLLLEGSTPADRGKLRWVATQNLSNTNAQTTGTITGGVWQHAAGVEITTSSRKVYLNGTDIGTNAVLKDPLASAHDRMAIGADGEAPVGDFWDGDLGHVAIWSAALSDQEVLSLSNGASPLNIQRDALIAYYPINGPSPESMVVDPVYDMTVNGTPAVAEEPSNMICSTIISPN